MVDWKQIHPVPRFIVREIVTPLVSFYFVALMLLLPEGLSTRGFTMHASYAPVAGLAVCGGELVFLLWYGFFWRRVALARLNTPAGAGLRVYAVLAPLLWLTGLFGEISRYWYFAFGGFTTSGADYWEWVRFGVAWALDSLTFNLSQIFAWPVSDIQATALVPRLLVFGYTVALEALILANLFDFVRTRWLQKMRAQGAKS
jgi:hypothetical protein